MKYWIKFPAPGQFRGEGEWQEVTEQEFSACPDTWLPKHQGDSPPTQEQAEV